MAPAHRRYQDTQAKNRTMPLINKKPIWQPITQMALRAKMALDYDLLCRCWFCSTTNKHATSKALLLLFNLFRVLFLMSSCAHSLYKGTLPPRCGLIIQMGRRSHFAFRVRSGWWKPLHLNFKWRCGPYFIPIASGKPQNGVISPKIFLKPILSQEGVCVKDADKTLLLKPHDFWVVYKSSFMRVKASCLSSVWGTKNWKMLTIAVCCAVILEEDTLCTGS